MTCEIPTLLLAGIRETTTHSIGKASWHNKRNYQARQKTIVLNCRVGTLPLTKTIYYRYTNTHGIYSVGMLPFRPAEDDVEDLETDWAVGCHLIGECDLDGDRCLVVFSHGHHLCHVIREPVW